MLEERRNPALRRTLETVGAAASRQVFENFRDIMIHSFEPRTGPALMEWVIRELSSSDLVIAIDGMPVELTRWIANLDHAVLTRAFVTYRPETLTVERAAELEVERFDVVLASGPPAVELDWEQITPVLAPQDRAAIPSAHLPPGVPDSQESLDEVANRFERLVELVRSRVR